MKRLAASIVLLILLSLSAQAQGLYKTQYRFNDNTNITYDGLLAWYGTGQPSFMRIRFYHPDLRRYILVQEKVTFVSVKDGYVLLGSEPFFLPPVPYGQGYNADTFVFGRLATGYFGCLGVVDTTGKSIGTVTEFRPLAPAELAGTLPAFGFPYQNTNTNTNTNYSTNNTTATMHLIVVADTEDTNIGTADAVDARGIIREFQIAAQEIGVDFKPVGLWGNTFGKDSVVNALNSLNPGPNDIVVFVYTGHGFRFNNDTDPYPRFSLARNRQSPVYNNLSASDVFGALKRKRSRLNITIVDSCNSEIGLDKPDYSGGILLKPSDAGISRRAVASLFLETRGNIIVAAASKGEKSGTNASTGSYFIHSFLNAFMYETSLVNSGSPSWQRIITSARSAAYTSSGGQQNAISYIE